MPTRFVWELVGRRKELLEQLKQIPDAGGKDLSKVVEDALIEYIKHHSSGNPAFKLDQFTEPDFHIAPAFFSNSTKWLNYSKDLSDREYSELRSQLNIVESAIIDSKKLTGR